jgi:minor extracellular serine protease Vpr
MRYSVILCLMALPVFGAVRSRMVEYALVLEDAPVVEQIATRAELAGHDARLKLARIETAQRSVRTQLAARKFAVRGAVQLLANAVFVSAEQSRAAELRSIAGVKRVQRLPRLKRHLNTALDLMNVQQAWTNIGGSSSAGAGVKIGILDTGIDQAHAGFQDASLATPSGFPKGESAYTNGKVIVARSYVSLLVNPDNDAAYSRPDDLSPRDRVGHGTAIAMIAAGAQNTGPAATIQGVAPKAWLGNYKIFGSPGVNDVTFYSVLAKAMDDAYTDGMDIVTLSLGEGDPSIFGPADTDTACGTDSICDVRAQMVENAVAKGLTVICSAGNSGDYGLQFPMLNSIHTPGTAPSAITVGATTNRHIWYASLKPQGGTAVKAIFGNGPKLSAAFTAQLKDVTATGNDGLACTTLAAGSLTGYIALIQRGTCAFSDKAAFAVAAGAVAVVIYQSSGNDYPFEIKDANFGVPIAMVGYTDGVSLKTAASSTPNVTLDPALAPVDATYNTVWDSSSRGPAIGTLGIKPEIAAVGTDLYTAAQKLDPNGQAYAASGYTTVTGTSYAVPMVAGAVALVKQKYPTLTPALLKSLVVNTARHDDVTGTNGLARVTDFGAGKLNAADAVNATAAAEPATLSFGVITSSALPKSLTLKLTNIGSATATFNFAVNQRASDTDSRASVSVQPTSLQLTAGQQQSVTVTLQGSLPSAGTYEGYIDITGSGSTLHVPYLYIVSSNLAYNAFPVVGATFTGNPGDDFWSIAFRVTDQYGAPVSGLTTQFAAVTGGGTISLADASTDINGLAYANIALGSQLGDQIFTGTAGGLSVEFDGFAGVAPAISTGGVVNAASNVFNKGLAPGSYISIYGSALAPSTSVAQTSSLPLSLATVSVSFDAATLSVPGHLHFISPGQINVQIPWELQGQSSVQMKVSIGDISTSLFTLALASTSPGIFVRNGLAAALDTNYALIDSSNPAQRGQAVQLYVNGLGAVDNTPVSGEPTSSQTLARTTAQPTVTIGGQTATVLFSGLAPGNVGLYQVNVTVPSGAPTGSQPVVISIGGADSPSATMPVQ